jgi:hypothetical protein
MHVAYVGADGTSSWSPFSYSSASLLAGREPGGEAVETEQRIHADPDPSALAGEGCHQGRNTQEIHDPFEIGRQGRQAPFGSHFWQAFYEQVPLVVPGLDGAKRMRNPVLTLLLQHRIGLHPFLPPFKDVFMNPTGHAPAGFRPRTLRLELTPPARRSCLVAYRPPRSTVSTRQGKIGPAGHRS